MARKPIDRALLLGRIDTRIKELESEPPCPDPVMEARRQQLISTWRTTARTGRVAHIYATALRRFPHRQAN